MSNKIYPPFISDMINLYIYISLFGGLYQHIAFFHLCYSVSVSKERHQKSPPYKTEALYLIFYVKYDL